MAVTWTCDKCGTQTLPQPSGSNRPQHWGTTRAKDRWYDLCGECLIELEELRRAQVAENAKAEEEWLGVPA